MNLTEGASQNDFPFTLVQDGKDCGSSTWLGSGPKPYFPTAQACAQACKKHNSSAQRFVWVHGGDKNCKCASSSCSLSTSIKYSTYAYRFETASLSTFPGATTVQTVSGIWELKSASKLEHSKPYQFAYSAPTTSECPKSLTDGTAFHAMDHCDKSMDLFLGKSIPLGTLQAIVKKLREKENLASTEDYMPGKCCVRCSFDTLSCNHS